MFKFILPIVLVAAAAASFFVFSNPLYKNISFKKEQIASYNEALDNSKALEALRDRLTQKYNSFNPEDLSRLEKLLPDNVDNIRLILEIEKIASPYGMVLRDVKYSVKEKNTVASPPPAASVPGGKIISNKDYGIWDLEFSTQGTYLNFTSFLKDLEKNLRIVDISSIQFLSNANTGAKLNPSLSESYRYSFKIKTYWLKN